MLDARFGDWRKPNLGTVRKMKLWQQHQSRHSIYAAEATGLLIMAILLLVLIIIRYWRDIPWSAR